MSQSPSSKRKRDASARRHNEPPRRPQSSTFERPGLQAELEQLRVEVQRLEQIVASQKRLLSELTHSLRSPLNTILGWTELLLENAGAEPSLESHVANGLRVIQRNAKEQARLLELVPRSSAGGAAGDGSVRLSLRVTEGGVEIEVEDAGVDPALVPQLVARYPQADAGQRIAGQVGFAIANALVELHGGTLRLEDSPAGPRPVVALPNTSR